VTTTATTLVDLEVEEAILGALLLTNGTDPKLVQTVRKLLPSPEYFSLARHQLIYRGMCELIDKGVALDVFILRDHFDGLGLLTEVGGVEGIATLAETIPTGANGEFHGRIIRDLADRRKLVSQAEKLRMLATDRSISLHDTVAETVGDLARSMVYVKGRSPKKWTTALLDAAEVIEARAKNPKGFDGIPCGLPDLDRVVGGAKPGELIILAARPSIGKSSLMCQMTGAAAAHFDRTTPEDETPPVAAIASLEMSVEKLTLRFLSNTADIPLGRLMKDGTLSDSDISRIHRAYSFLGNLPLYLMDSSTHEIRTPGALRLAVEHLQAVDGCRIGFLAVDYLQYMRADGKEDSRNLELGMIAKALKTLGAQMGFPVLLLAQLNRELEKAGRKPRSSDLRDSGEIEQDADKIILLHAEPRNEEWDPGLIEAIVDKNRDGDTGLVKLSFDKATQRWRGYTKATQYPAVAA